MKESHWTVEYMENINAILMVVSMILMLLGCWTRRDSFFVCSVRLTSFTWPRTSYITLLTGILLPLFISVWFLPSILNGFGNIFDEEDVPRWHVWLFKYSLVNNALVTAFPSMTYLTFALILRDHLAQNNNSLLKLLENDQRPWLSDLQIDSEEELFKIYNTFVALRQLYKEIVFSQSVSLLGVHVLSLSWLSNTVVFVLNVREANVASEAPLPILILLLMLLQGHVADAVREEVELELPIFSVILLIFCSYRMTLHKTTLI